MPYTRTPEKPVKCHIQQRFLQIQPLEALSCHLLVLVYGVEAE